MELREKIPESPNALMERCPQETRTVVKRVKILEEAAGSLFGFGVGMENRFWVRICSNSSNPWDSGVSNIIESSSQVIWCVMLSAPSTLMRVKVSQLTVQAKYIEAVLCRQIWKKKITFVAERRKLLYLHLIELLGNRWEWDWYWCRRHNIHRCMINQMTQDVDGGLVWGQCREREAESTRGTAIDKILSIPTPSLSYVIWKHT